MRRAGFTFIELMVVVVIIAALAAMVLPHVLPREQMAKEKIALGSMASIKTQLDMFRLDVGRYPTTSEGLKSLRERPASVSSSSWRGPYLERPPLDPWQRSFEYKFLGKNVVPAYDLWSKGADENDAADDIKFWASPE